MRSMRAHETAWRIPARPARRSEASVMVRSMLRAEQRALLPRESRCAEGTPPAELGRTPERESDQDDFVPARTPLRRLRRDRYHRARIRPPARQSENVSALMKSTSSWWRIETEILKCVVRCANCHRRVTERRRPRVPTVVVAATKRRARGSARRIEAPLDSVRLCRVCGQMQALSDFPYRSLAKGTRQWICLSCQRAYSRAWYERNSVRQRQTARRTAVRLRATASAFVAVYLAAHPCSACGESDVAVLDFDHQRDKVKNISAMVRQGWGTEAIALEIAKCVVLCANCHRRATALRGRWYRTRRIQEDDLRPGRLSTSRRLAS